jgi:hypothetical protein
MNRIAASSTMGAFAGCLLAGAYLGAPLLGLHLSPSLVLVLAACVAFGSSVTVISLNLLAQRAKSRQRASSSGCSSSRPVGLVNFNDLLVGTMRSADSANTEPIGVSLLGSPH